MTYVPTRGGDRHDHRADVAAAFDRPFRARPSAAVLDLRRNFLAETIGASAAGAEGTH